MAKTARNTPIGDPPAPGRGARSQREPVGPYRASLIREGDHREVSRGYPVLTSPAGGRHSSGTLYGGAIVDSDPATPGAGVDLGFSSDQTNLRAPDVAVTPHTDAEGWVSEYPPLAIEYAGRYQREDELQDKISDLLAGGTAVLWVVRLTGDRHVEIHQPGQPMRIARPGEDLVAPGILAAPIRVEALWDREAAHDHTLRNLLRRRGFADLDAVMASGEARAKADAILLILRTRGLSVTEAQRVRVLSQTDLAQLDAWMAGAVTTATASDLLGDPT